MKSSNISTAFDLHDIFEKAYLEKNIESNDISKSSWDYPIFYYDYTFNIKIKTFQFDIASEYDDKVTYFNVKDITLCECNSAKAEIRRVHV